MNNDLKNKVKSEIADLIELGNALYYRLLLSHEDFDDLPAKPVSKADKEKVDQFNKIKDLAKGAPYFSSSYEQFYTAALSTIRMFAPDRLVDFQLQYRNEKRKDVSVATYLISDAIVGYRHTYGNYSKTSALPRLKTQIDMLSAVQLNIDLTLSNLDSLIRADLFDDELASAEHLLKRSHRRAAGAVAGVVLETHLGVVAEKHGYAARKQNPTIADFNDYLKSSAIYDVVYWRKIQSLADIRNLCDHQKGREPADEDVSDLIIGVRRIVKEIH